MNPTCPTDYTCQFNLVKPRVVYHTVGPWYQHTAGWIVAIIAILALASLIAWGLSLYYEHKAKRDTVADRERERVHNLAIEEQRTMQIDAAKGNPEMLKIVSDQHYGYR